MITKKIEVLARSNSKETKLLELVSFLEEMAFHYYHISEHRKKFKFYNSSNLWMHYKCKLNDSHKLAKHILTYLEIECTENTIKTNPNYGGLKEIIKYSLELECKLSDLYNEVGKLDLNFYEYSYFVKSCDRLCIKNDLNYFMKELNSGVEEKDLEERLKLFI